jgi:cytoskeleton protein RodZ
MSESVHSGSGATDASAPASRLGAELRARRQSLGWSLTDLAASLRIRQGYLEAIEAGRIGDLPGTTYALGFVRAYASAMGLQGEQVASRFRAESAEASIRPALSFPVPVPQRGVPAGALMLLGLVIMAGAYSGWYYVSEHQRTPAETVPPIPDRLLPHTVEKPTPSPQVASILPTASAPTQPAPTPGAAPQAPNASPAPSPAQNTAPAPLAARPVPEPAPAPAPAAPPAQGAQPAALPPGSRIVVKATADAWVSVKPKGGGAAVFNKLMHAGDSWAVPASPPDLLLTTGNAGGTQLTADTVAVPSLGGSGAVFRDLPLDADMLKSGHLPPSRPAHPKPAAPTPAAAPE